MIENLGIALRKQKKLVVIFFLTIFLPAVALSVFGIRAIRNERFRLAKQEETESRKAALSIKTASESLFAEMGIRLKALARNPFLIESRIAVIPGILEKTYAEDKLVGEVVLLYKDKEALFPLLQAPRDAGREQAPRAEDLALAEMIKKAEAAEFVDKNLGVAATLFHNLHNAALGHDLKAEMLAGQARCLEKAGRYREAIFAYARIERDYPTAFSASGVPLGLLAGLQTIGCCLRMGEFPSAGENAVRFYRDLLRKPSALDNDQFETYASIATESIDGILAEHGGPVFDDYRKEYKKLKNIQSVRIKERQTAELLKRDVVPDLVKKFAQPETSGPEPFRFSKSVDGRDILLLASWIPGRDGNGHAGMLGVLINNDQFLQGLLSEAVANARTNVNADIVLSDLSGRTLLGTKSSPGAIPIVTDFFDENFPPWKIDVVPSPTTSAGSLGFQRSFFFWTILTLLVVLGFGAFLTVRTISHEIEILKIKSDFVSAVSHEFKTPLTSIKALMERLVEGKVSEPGKMGQYFSVIAGDADKLSRLVNNLLDFSKIEEGKKVYDFSETDIVRIATDQVSSFRRELGQAGPDIRLEITGDLPCLQADADALSRALGNLLGNAVKFTPPERTIRVVVSRREDNVILEVADEGVGIPPEELGKVFDKFFQGRNAPGQSRRGTGLGLTLVKHIVEAHGGKVVAESRLGRGSKFSMIFPIRS
jgi:signal transduction histidine kinase/tetratricopeptide (TPR) repeat protein